MRNLKQELQNKYGFDEIQAEEILDWTETLPMRIEAGMVNTHLHIKQGVITAEPNDKDLKGGSLTSTYTDKVTRVEVIDSGGRAYVSWDKDNKVESQLQDDERTLKIFITKSNEH